MDLPDPEIERLLRWQSGSLPPAPPGKPVSLKRRPTKLLNVQLDRLRKKTEKAQISNIRKQRGGITDLTEKRGSQGDTKSNCAPAHQITLMRWLNSYKRHDYWHWLQGETEKVNRTITSKETELVLQKPLGKKTPDGSADEFYHIFKWKELISTLHELFQNGKEEGIFHNSLYMALNYLKEMQATRNIQNNLGRELSSETHISQFPNSPKATVISAMLGLGIDTQTNGRDLAAQTEILTFPGNWILIKVLRQFNGERKVFKQTVPKTEPGFPPYTIHKCQLKMKCRRKCENIKIMDSWDYTS